MVDQKRAPSTGKQGMTPSNTRVGPASPPIAPRAPAQSNSALLAAQAVSPPPSTPRFAGASAHDESEPAHTAIDRDARAVAAQAELIAREAMAVARDAIARLERLEVKMADLVLARREAAVAAARPVEPPSGVELVAKTDAGWESERTMAHPRDSSRETARELPAAESKPEPEPAPEPDPDPAPKHVAEAQANAPPPVPARAAPAAPPAANPAPVEAPARQSPSMAPLVVTEMPSDPLSLPISIAPQPMALPSGAPGAPPVDLAGIDDELIAHTRNRKRKAVVVLGLLIAAVVALVVVAITSH